MNPIPALRIAISLLLLTVMTVAGPSWANGADDAGATQDAHAAPRRSHIQPVGEMAAARNSDTLGLRLARASEVLRQQLALSRGAGLVVEEVIEGSIADKAGFKRYDVLVLLDDQMLLLPEQLAALLEASDSGTAPECTLLRGGAKVTIPLAQPGQVAQPRITRRAPAAAQPPPAAAVRQLAAKPSAQSRLRPAASTLALVQPANAATKSPGSAREPHGDAETLLRHDPDCVIRLSRAGETRLTITDLRGRVVFDREIDTVAGRELVPPAMLDRVEEMERSLESKPRTPVEIGRLEIAPVEIR